MAAKMLDRANGGGGRSNTLRDEAVEVRRERLLRHLSAV